MEEIPSDKEVRSQALSPREREVMDLLATGATNPEIAEQLIIGQSTVKTHVGHIIEKLGARNRTDAVVRYLRDSD